MAITRRRLLKAGGAVCTGALSSVETLAAEPEPPAERSFGVLMDTTACIGCRKCEWACNHANNLPLRPLEEFEDTTVFAERRRPDATHYTVVNRFSDADGAASPIHVKAQCMHCNDPACVSACLVSAMVKQPSGAVTYDPWRCMGCRYCMVVCPFGLPAYEYDNPTTPRVRKCELCHERVTREGRLPACVEICPPECLVFGIRSDLLDVAHRRIREYPQRYADHVYGETEVGGTAWLYLARTPFEALDLPTLGPEAPPRLTEGLQHGLFRGFIPPLSLFAVLAAAMAIFRGENDEAGRSGREGM